MLDSPFLDEALDLILSLASVSFEAALKGVRLLSSLTGGRLEAIVAGVAGLLTFILTFRVISDRRPRDEVLKAWPSREPSPAKVPETASHGTIRSRIVEAPRRVEKERLELTDELRDQLHKRFVEAASEPSLRESVPTKPEHSWHPWRAGFSRVIAVIRALSNEVARVFRFSTARTQSRGSCNCDWQRVARYGWADSVLSYFGWYPWQCQNCFNRSHFRRRY